MAEWSQNRRGSGIWKLTARLPSSSVHVWFLHDDGGRHRVMMMEMPFGAHPVAVIEGGHKALGNRQRAGSRIPLRRQCPDLSRCHSRSPTGLTLMLGNAVRECNESRGTRHSESLVAQNDSAPQGGRDPGTRL